jgi:predicted hotdog family 3-hydroxylacyl-ACP dehydratase
VIPDIEHLVPHRGAMSWLDRVVDAGPEHVVAEATVRADHLLLKDGRLSASAGLEYMAQAVAAWAGWQRHCSDGGPPRIGFLLGTRRYQCSRSFKPGDLLQIRVNRQFQAENGLSQFDTDIRIGDQIVAHASLNVFGPDNPEAFLASQNA